MDKLLNKSTEGFMVACDTSGMITEIIYDDFSTFGNLPQGINLLELIEPSDAEKFTDFIQNITDKKGCHSWEMHLSIEDKLRLFNFLGVKMEENKILIAATFDENATEYLHEMLAINNENSNLIRSMYREMYHKAKENEENFNNALLEFSKMNNELSSLHRELAKKNIEFEMLHKEKDRFIGMLAHDLRNPLGNIVNLSKLLIEKNKVLGNKKDVETLELIRSMGDFVLKMIAGLLDIQVMESGKFKFNFEKADFISLSQRIFQSNALLAEKKRIQLELSHTDNEIFAIVDANTIQQVINNLLSNAIKFSYPESKIWLLLSQSENDVTFEVKDQGTGIKESDIEKLFKPFPGISSGGTEDEKNTGIGLTIVKSIIDAHKGTITVK